MTNDKVERTMYMRHGTIPGICCMAAVAVLVMPLLGGCTKGPGEGPDGLVPVAVDVRAEATKAAYSGDDVSFVSGDTVGVYEVRHFPDGTSSTTKAEYTYDGTSWSSTSPLLAGGSSTYSFGAYYPPRAEGKASFLISSDQSGQGGAGTFWANDWVVTAPGAAGRYTGGAVALTMEHLLTLVTVRLRFSGEFLTEPEVSSVAVSSPTTVLYSEDFQSLIGTGQYIAKIKTEKSPVAGAVFPSCGQEFTAVVAAREVTGAEDVIFITLVDGRSYRVGATAGSPLEFAAGKRLVCTVDVGRDEASLSSGVISGWGSGTAEKDTTDTGGVPYNLFGSGTATDPYRIYNASQMKSIASDYHPGSGAGSFFRLMNDIDLNPGITIAPDGKCTDSSGAAASPCEWTAVGSMSARFTGEFDGNGHTVRGVYIDKPGSDYQGLFGVIGSGGEVKDLTVKESFICGRSSTGGISGGSMGTISGCSFSGGVKGSGSSVVIGGICGRNYSGTVKYCSFTGSVSGSSSAGGVCGYNLGGTITNCTVSGAVTSTGDVAGGVCGENDCTIANCTGSGSVTSTGNGVGGICGYNSGGTITNCTGSGAVSGSSSVGGVCGFNEGGGTIKNCYYDSTVYTGSGIGGSSSVEAIGLPTATMTSTTETVLHGTYFTMPLLGALKAGAAAYNAASPAPSVKACSWKQTSGKYPELDFTAKP